MALSTSQILNTLHATAQDNVPLTPANGNPNGAYNMPQQEQATPSVPTSPYLTYSVSNPSPYMQGIAAMLNKGKAALNVTGTDAPASDASQVNIGNYRV